MRFKQGNNLISATKKIRFTHPVFMLVKTLGHFSDEGFLCVISKGRSLCNEELFSLRLFLGNALRGYRRNISYSGKEVYV